MCGMIRNPHRAATLLALPLLVVALAGCSGPGGAGGADPGAAPEPAFEQDPWLVDDLELDAAVATADFQGIPIFGFTCDKTYITAGGRLADDDWATVSIAPESTGIVYTEPGGISQGDAAGHTVGTLPETVTVSVANGLFHIGDGGSNTQTFSATMEVLVRAVPVPEGACWAADKWVTDMQDVGTDRDEIFRALTEDGLLNTSGDCDGYEWIPPHLTCEEWTAFDQGY
jgi:hypothetical protein